MPHICHISTTFNLRSGSARRTSAILKGCLAQGYKVSLIIGRDFDVSQEDLPGVDIFVVPGLVKHISPWRDAIVLWKVRSILKRIKPDLVHTHLAKAGIVGRLSALGARVPCIMHTVHGPTFPQHFHPIKRFLFCSLEKLCGRFTNRFVFVGHDLQNEYLQAGVCSQDIACVVQTGRPDTIFNRTLMSETGIVQLRSELCGSRNPEMLIVTVGRLVPSKQLEHAIRITKALHRKNVLAHLCIVGKCLLEKERQYEEKLMQLVSDLEVHQFVHFTGFRNDNIDIMEVADAVLLTTCYEGLPNVAVEAVISGTPMITYNVSGVREIIKEDVSGWIIPLGDMDQAVNRLAQLTQKQSNIQDTHDNPDDNTLEDFRESVMVERKIQMYKQYFLNCSNLET